MNPSFRRPAAVLLALALAAPGATARTPAPADAPPPAPVKALLACQPITDPAQRLACYDNAAGAFAKAYEKHEVMVVDRAEAKAAKRSLFGFSVPHVKLFGGNDDVEIKAIDTTLAEVRSRADGSQVIVLEDGSRWLQTDGPEVSARRGVKVQIVTAAFGSFFATIDGQPGHRVMRLPN